MPEKENKKKLTRRQFFQQNFRGAIAVGLFSMGGNFAWSELNFKDKKAELRDEKDH